MTDSPEPLGAESPIPESPIPESTADRELFDELRRAARDPDPEGPGLEEALAGRYEMLGEIHRGGQGTVYKAREVGSGRNVALKVLPAGRRASLRERYRFEREVELAQSLDHPNIVKVYEACAVQGHVFYVMELIEGLALDELLTTARLDPRQKIAMFLKICEGVTYAHRRGVIHRDLKPSNILVDGQGEPHVLDFGLAKRSEGAAPRVTVTGEFMGTLAYAAPEQLGGKASSVDLRSDVYSLGVILYEMLAGSLPYDVTGSIGDLMDRIAAAPPRPAGLDEDLRTITHKALSVEPDRRYPSVEALSLDLGRYLCDEPIEARRDSSWYIARKWLRRHRRGVGVGLGVAVLACSVLAVILATGSERRQRVASQEIGALFTRTLTDAPDQLGPDAATTILERTVAQLHDTLSDAPEVKAELHLTVGEMYRRLMMIDEARPNLRAAVDLYRQVYGPEHLQVAEALDLLGQACTVRSDPEAVDHLEEALRIRLMRLGSEHPQVAITRRHLGDAVESSYYGPDPARAERLYREALQALEAVYDEGHLEVALSRHALDVLLSDQLEDEELERRLLRDLAVFRREASGDGAHAIEGLQDYFVFLTDRQRWDEAEAVLAECTGLMERAYGSRQVPDLLWRTGRFQFVRGNLLAAGHYYASSVAEQLLAWRDKSPEHAERLASLAAAFRAGEMPFRQAYQILVELEGVGKYELAAEMADVAELQAGQGDVAGAEALLTDSLVVHCREFGMDCPYRVDNLFALGRLRLQRQAWDEAAAALAEVVEIRQRVGSLQTVPGARAQTALAAALIELGDGQRAEQLLLSAWTVFEADLVAHLPDARTNLCLLQELLIGRGEAERAAVIGTRIAELDSVGRVKWERGK